MGADCSERRGAVSLIACRSEVLQYARSDALFVLQERINAAMRSDPHVITFDSELDAVAAGYDIVTRSASCSQPPKPFMYGELLDSVQSE